MKATLTCFALLLAAPLIAADAGKILLSGAAVNAEDARVSGTARAIVGDMTVRADAITFDRATNALRCEGAAAINVAGNVVKAHDCTIELGAGEKKLFFLSRGNIELSPSPGVRFYPASSNDLIGPAADREKMLQDFRARVDARPAPKN